MQIPILGQNPGFADDVFSLNIDQVDPFHCKVSGEFEIFPGRGDNRLKLPVYSEPGISFIGQPRI